MLTWLLLSDSASKQMLGCYIPNKSIERIPLEALSETSGKSTLEKPKGLNVDPLHFIISIYIKYATLEGAVHGHGFSYVKSDVFVHFCVT